MPLIFKPTHFKYIVSVCWLWMEEMIEVPHTLNYLSVGFKGQMAAGQNHQAGITAADPDEQKVKIALEIQNHQADPPPPVAAPEWVTLKQDVPPIIFRSRTQLLLLWKPQFQVKLTFPKKLCSVHCMMTVSAH